MNIHLLAVLLIPVLAAAPKESPVNKPLEDFAGVARYLAPEGWLAEKAESPAAPSVRLSRGQDVIKVRLFGGKGSRYARPADYLKGFEATTMGNPPERLLQAKVAGLKVWVYRHGYPLVQGDPHVMDPRPPMLANEEFCILPAGSRFLVLSWAVERGVPDPEAADEASWQAFLSAFSLVKK